MVLEVKGFDARFSSLGFIEVLVDGRGLRFPKPDKVDNVGEDLHQTIVCWFEEVGKRKVGDTALDRWSQDRSSVHGDIEHEGSAIHLNEQPPQRNIKPQ